MYSRFVFPAECVRMYEWMKFSFDSIKLFCAYVVEIDVLNYFDLFAACA
jgi:hypothetical protein